MAKFHGCKNTLCFAYPSIFVSNSWPFLLSLALTSQRSIYFCFCRVLGLKVYITNAGGELITVVNIQFICYRVYCRRVVLKCLKAAYYLFKCLYVYLHVTLVPRHACGGQRITHRICGSFYYMKPGAGTQIIRLGSKHLYLLSHLTRNCKVYASLGSFSKSRRLWLFYMIEIEVTWRFCLWTCLYSGGTFKSWPISMVVSFFPLEKKIRIKTWF